MYKVYFTPDKSRLLYPDRRVYETVSVTEIGEMTPWKGYSTEVCHGNVYLLQYVYSGKGKFKGKPFTAPCIWIVAPGDKFSYSIDDDSAHVEENWMKINGNAAKSFLSEAGFPTESTMCPLPYAKEAHECFRELMNEINYTNVDDRYYMLQGFFTLCALQRNSLNSAKNNKKLSPYVSKAIEYIQTHYEEQITEKTLAEHLYISVNYMHRLFLSNTGMTPNYYINNYRISLAKKMLQNTSLSIAQISESVGFSSGDYFCRVFKKFMGCSPSHYRRNSKKNYK